MNRSPIKPVCGFTELEGATAQPNQDVITIPVDLRHHVDLMTTFLHISLVNADLVNPDESPFSIGGKKVI